MGLALTFLIPFPLAENKKGLCGKCCIRTLQPRTGKYRVLQGNPCNENRIPAMRTGFPAMKTGFSL